MAKERKANTIQDAITSLTAALRLESKPNPTAAEKEQIHQAKIQAADCIDNSNFMTVAENADEAIEEQHQQAEQAEEAEAGDAEHDQIEAEIEAMGILDEDNTDNTDTEDDDIPF